MQKSLTDSVKRWLIDIGIAKSAREKRVVFVCKGGTCRSAIAKVVLQQTLQQLVLPFRLNVIGAAKSYARTPSASNGARAVIKQAYGAVLLNDHVVTMLCPGSLEEADLIIPMSKDLCVGFENEVQPRVQLFKHFFLDEDGDVKDPWSFKDTETATQEYENCLAEIKQTIEQDGSIDKLINALSSA